MSAKKLIAANWKMNGSGSLVAAVEQQLQSLVPEIDVLICPPATLLSQFKTNRSFALGVQNISEHDDGAYTGEISASLAIVASFMLKQTYWFVRKCSRQ